MNSYRKPGESELFYFLKVMSRGSIAGSVAEAVSLPVDTAKVRL